MAKYKTIDTGPKLLPVGLRQQLLPGRFEHALDYLIDHEVGLSRFDARYATTRAAPAPKGLHGASCIG